MPREALVLPVSLALLASAGLLLPPIFSPDRDLVVVPLAIALGLWAVLRVPDRRCEPLLVAFLATALVLVLLGRWHAGQSAGAIIGGRIPFSDQAAYVVDALRLGEGHRLSPFSSRRPLHVLFLAAILKVAQGNIAVASVLMCIVAALALAALALAVRRTHGTTAAVVLALLCVLFYRRFVGTGLSEHAGFILGCLAAALLWRGAGTRAPRELYGGAFLLTLALVARAGCFFVLPFLVLWIASLLRKGRWISLRAGLLAGAAVGAGFLCNFALLRLFGQPDSAFSNFPVVLYGLISGGNWTTAYAEHPEIRTLPESEAAARVLGFAFAKLREDPWSLVRGVLRSWWAFLGPTYGQFTFLQLGQAEFMELTRSFSGWSGLWPPALARIAAGFGIHRWTTVLYHGMCTILPWLLFLVGAVSVARAPRDAQARLLAAFWGGILLSIPFVPPWDGDLMRVYAATMPVQLVLPALGASRLVGWLRTRLAPARIERGATRTADSTAARTVGLAAVSALLPALVVLKVGMPAAAPQPAPDLACARGEPHLVMPIRGTEVVLGGKRAGLLQPTYEGFQSGLAPLLGMYPDLLGPLADLAPGTVLTAVRYVDKPAYGVLARPAGPAPAAPIGVCVEGRPLLIRMEDSPTPTL